jgi:hypothetical protein
MLVKVVARSGRELVPGGLDVKARACGAAQASRRSPRAEAAGVVRAGQQRGRPHRRLPRGQQAEEGA